MSLTLVQEGKATNSVEILALSQEHHSNVPEVAFSCFQLLLEEEFQRGSCRGGLTWCRAFKLRQNQKTTQTHTLTPEAHRVSTAIIDARLHNGTLGGHTHGAQAAGQQRSRLSHSVSDWGFGAEGRGRLLELDFIP